MSGAVSTRDFGTREDAVITDLETEGASPDTHTLMGLTKGQLQRLGELVDAIDLLPKASATTSMTGVGDVIEVALSLDTSAYADNDVLAAPQEVKGFFRLAGGQAYLHSLVVNDLDDQAQDMDIVFLSVDGSVGAENAAFAPADAVAATIVGAVSLVAADYVDAGNSQFVVKTNVGLKMKAAPGSTSVWVAAVCRSGTPTYTATGIRLTLGVVWD